MTMKIRITNESAGTQYRARVTVIDTHLEEPVVADTFDLEVGQSRETYLHGTRHIEVLELQPDR